MNDDIPYILRGVAPIATKSSLLVSSSKYLNNSRLREWVAMVCLRRNGPDFPLPAELYELLQLLNELQEFDRIEEMFTRERAINPRLDAWFQEGYYSPPLVVADYRHYASGTVGHILYTQFGDEYEAQIDENQFRPAATQYEFYRRRQVQQHDLEHILTGGGIDAFGELVPAYHRMTNLPRFFHDQELAGELILIHIFATLRYTVRTMLHYPQVWTYCADATQRGIAGGMASDAFFMMKLEPLLHLPLAAAREAIGLRNIIDRDTSQASAFWESRVATPPPPLFAA